MKLSVSHFTRYDYSQAVTLSPHRLFLRPREGPQLRLLKFSFNISPEPKLVWTRDPLDVVVGWAYFWDGASALSIRSQFEVETFDANPFDFILSSHAVRHPFSYDREESAALTPYRVLPAMPDRGPIEVWLQERLPKRPVETLPLLNQLCTLVYTSLTYVRREERGIQTPAETLSLGSGACRDYAVLFVESCRVLGLAARFVSGYLYSPPEDNHRSAGAMHAWAEVYLPGAGWRGIDPTHGIFCDDAFVPVAHAADASTVNPIQGTLFSGSQAVTAALQVDVRVDRLEPS